MCGKKLDLLDQESESLAKPMNDAAEWGLSFSALLEFAADNNVEGFKQQLSDVSCINQVGLWYRRQSVVRRMVVEERTPLMVASIYGSLDVVKFIVSFAEAELNLCCGPDKSTALHCAASGGSVNSLDVVKLLLSSGADPSIHDAHGNRPYDVLVVSPRDPGLRTILEEILKKDETISEDLDVSSSSLGSSFRSLSPSRDSVSSPTKPNVTDVTFASEKKEYPIDPSLPDIKSEMYLTDEFRMFSFKIRPCSRAYSHDWTECPFVHPGENARRRDPRKFHYTCVPCPDFKKGTCKQGDMCEYAHGVFESWLHPAQYRTRLCKDGISCNRRVCFFAHTNEELRPLYPSTGSGLPSPRESSTVSAPTMDMASVLNMLPGSPISPRNAMMSHSSMGWPQQNIPALHLPGSNVQLSRLRSSLNARDMPSEQLSILHELELQRQLSGDMCSPRYMNHSARPKALTPSNLDELFSAEVSSSPRFSDQLAVSSVLSPSHKSALLNQLQSNKQSMLSPIKTNLMSSSPKNMEQRSLLQQASSPRAREPISPMNSRLQQQLHSRSLSSREFGSSLPIDSGSPLSPWSSWDHKVDWSVQSDELGRLRKSHSLANNNPNKEADDPSWAQHSAPPRNSNMSGARPLTQGGSSVDPHNSDTLDSWLDQLHLDG